MDEARREVEELNRQLSPLRAKLNMHLVKMLDLQAKFHSITGTP
jgi:hypothetical protein